MRKTIWDKRIPTLLGILLITVATFITSMLVEQGVIFVGKAAPSNVPQNVRITNVSSSSFTVSYTTDAEVFGSINYGKTVSLGQVALDERDKELRSRKLHSFNIKNLNPSTKYFFSITSSNESFLNNGLPYDVETGPQIAKDKTEITFLVGKIVTPSGSPPKEAIIYLAVEGAQPFSAVAKSDGGYTISLEELRSDNLSSFFEVPVNSVIRMLVIGDQGSSNVSILAKDVTSVPVIVLSKNYDFTQEVSVSTISATLQNFPDFPQAAGRNITPKITAPTDKQILTDARPTFRGTGVPGNEIKVVIESEIIETEITPDSNGNWSYRPPDNLTAGIHKISITTRDAFGVLRTITHSFTVEQAEAAQSPSPSATPTPTPTPIPTPSLSPTPIPTPISIPITEPISELPSVGSPVTIGGILTITKNLIGGLLFILSRGNVSL